MTSQTSNSSLDIVRALKRALVAEYGGFADRRIKDVDKGSLFAVDDHREGAIASDGSFYGWFCAVEINALDGLRVQVRLTNSIPDSSGIRGWEKQQRVTRQGTNLRNNRLQFDVTPEDVGKLLTLAKEMRAIVAPGARYEVPSYKYACPRAASALERLYNALTKHWNC